MRRTARGMFRLVPLLVLLDLAPSTARGLRSSRQFRRSLRHTSQYTNTVGTLEILGGVKSLQARAPKGTHAYIWKLKNSEDLALRIRSLVPPGKRGSFKLVARRLGETMRCDCALRWPAGHRDDYPWGRNVWNFHPEYEIHLIRNASGVALVGDHIGPFEPGYLVVVGSGLPHNWVTDTAPGELIAGRDILPQFDP
jgi:hypothetical protein